MGAATTRTPLAQARAGQWLLAAAVAGSALAVGTIHTVTLCAVTAALGAAALLTWWGGEPLRPRLAATMLLCTGIVLTAYTALQCLPIPASWLAALAGHNADVWSRALAPLHEAGPTWATISLDPVATRVEVLKGVAYLLAFVAALRVARNRSGVGFLSGAVVAAGAVLAVAALLHPAFGAHRLYGIFAPNGAAERHLAPLMNPNNLASYLNVALCLALAAALAPQPRVPRTVAGAVVLLLAATQVWVASRGGVVTMVLGALVVVFLARTAGARRQAMTVSLGVGMAAALGAVLVVLGGSQEASDELLQSDTSKVGFLWRMMRMLPAVPWFGCGRGAFESAFPAFRTAPGYVSYVYPENVVAQWVLEWGLPVGLLGLGAIVIALRPTAVLARSATSAGAWAGLVALAVQNLADLGSEVPGVMLTGVVCAAIVTGGTRGHKAAGRVERWAQAPTKLALAAGLVATAGLTLGMSALGGELHADREALHDAAGDPHTSAERMRSLARAAMLRHPAEPYLPFMVAQRASNARDDNPLPWLGATLERARVYGPAHYVLARVVAARAPSQARLEYRLAIEQMPEFASSIIPETATLIGTYYDSMEVVPDGKAGSAVLDGLATAVRERLPSTAARLDAELLRRDPSSAQAALRRARSLVEDTEDGTRESWCEGALRDACLRSAVETATLARQLAPTRCDAYALVARARGATGDWTAALNELEKHADELPDRVACLETVESIALRAGDEVRAQRVVDKVANAGCADAATCAAQLGWAASQEQARGHLSKALSLLRRAHDRAPDDDGLQEAAARLASRLGLHAEAAEAFAQLAQRHPEDPRWKAAMDDERVQALRGRARL